MAPAPRMQQDFSMKSTQYAGEVLREEAPTTSAFQFSLNGGEQKFIAERFHKIRVDAQPYPSSDDVFIAYSGHEKKWDIVKSFHVSYLIIEFKSTLIR